MSRNGALDLHRLADLSQLGIRFQPCSLQIADDLSYKQAEKLCSGIGYFHDASKWWLGDLQVFIDDAFDQGEVSQLLEATGRSYHTLENYRYVSTHVAIPRRRAHVPHSYHAELASLSPADQIEWLDRIEANGWKLADLRAHLRAERHGKAELEQPSWSAEMAVDQERVVRLAHRAAAEASPLGDGRFIVPGEVIVQLRAAFGEGE